MSKGIKTCKPTVSVLLMDILEFQSTAMAARRQSIILQSEVLVSFVPILGRVIRICIVKNEALFFIEI